MQKLKDTKLFKNLRSEVLTYDGQNSRKHRIKGTGTKTFAWVCINFTTRESLVCMFL